MALIATGDLPRCGLPRAAAERLVQASPWTTEIMYRLLRRRKRREDDRAAAFRIARFLGRLL